jgi:hypothetical protein
MPVAYTPKLSPDDYRCFINDWPATGTKYVTGFRANPGNKSIVHHVIAYLAKPADVASYQALDDKDPDPGYVCFGGPGGDAVAAQWIGSWAPGAPGYDTAPGTGIKVPAGSKVVLQVHYNTASTAAAPDQTTLDFRLDDTVTKEAIQLPWADYTDWVIDKKMRIPAGSPDSMHQFDADFTPVLPVLSDMKDNLPVTMWSSAIHMHTHGTHGRIEIVRQTSGARECLLDVPRWDFHWQGGYVFQEQKTFNPGDQIHLECHFDNSTGTTDLNWGEGTGDEMCLGSFFITQ